jgi:hypothetical protein
MFPVERNSIRSHSRSHALRGNAVLAPLCGDRLDAER